jgi:hypothetical protein
MGCCGRYCGRRRGGIFNDYDFTDPAFLVDLLNFAVAHSILMWALPLARSNWRSGHDDGIWEGPGAIESERLWKILR